MRLEELSYNLFKHIYDINTCLSVWISVYFNKLSEIAYENILNFIRKQFILIPFLII